MKRFVRILRRWLFMAVLLTLLICIGLHAYRLVYSLSYQYDSELNSKNLAQNVTPDSSITNIALFGVDTREVDIGTRSDSMMVLTIDNTRHKLKLTSLMRDSLVAIDGHGKDKLCHAYSYGGPELAIRTINQNFGTDISEYAAVDFGQMKTLVDQVGGIYIDVSEKERKEANKFIREYQSEKGVPRKERTPIEEAGYQHLNGVQAMCYARIRKGGTGDDWGRVERQSVVLQAMFGQIQQMKTTELVALMGEMLPNVTTSLSPTEILPLFYGALKGGKPQIEHSRIPADGEWDYGGSSGEYITFDLEQAQNRLLDYIHEDQAPNTAKTAATSSAEE